jgi:hypothetical protein
MTETLRLSAAKEGAAISDSRRHETIDASPLRLPAA